MFRAVKYVLGGFRMEQLSLWDFKKSGVKIYERTGQIIGLGDEITLVRFRDTDVFYESVVKDRTTGKLYYKQESKRKDPVMINGEEWPRFSYSEIDEECFKKGFITDDLEGARIAKARKRNRENPEWTYEKAE